MPELNTAQQMLVEENLDLAPYMAHRMKTKCPMEFEDLLALCYYGLSKAAGTFKEGQNAKFSTWACNTIRFEILHEMKHFRRHNVDTVFFEDFRGDINWQDITDNGQSRFDEQIIARVSIEQASKTLTKNERIILDYMVEYTNPNQKQIEKETGIAQPHVSRYIKTVKQKLQAQLAG